MPSLRSRTNHTDRKILHGHVYGIMFGPCAQSWEELFARPIPGCGDDEVPCRSKYYHVIGLRAATGEDAVRVAWGTECLQGASSCGFQSLGSMRRRPGGDLRVMGLRGMAWNARRPVVCPLDGLPQSHFCTG